MPVNITLVLLKIPEHDKKFVEHDKDVYWTSLIPSVEFLNMAKNSLNTTKDMYYISLIPSVEVLH